MKYPRHEEKPPHNDVNDYINETVAILTVVCKDDKETFRDYLVFEISDSYGVVLHALTTAFGLHERKSKMYLRFDGDKEKRPNLVYWRPEDIKKKEPKAAVKATTFSEQLTAIKQGNPSIAHHYHVELKGPKR